MNTPAQFRLVRAFVALTFTFDLGAWCLAVSLYGPCSALGSVTVWHLVVSLYCHGSALGSVTVWQVPPGFYKEFVRIVSLVLVFKTRVSKL